MPDEPREMTPPTEQRHRGGVLGWWRQRSEMQKLGLIALVFVVVLGGRAILAGPEGDSGTPAAARGENQEEVTATTKPIPLSTYQNQAQEVPYHRLMADPAAYDGALLKFTGQVVDFETAQGVTILRLAVEQADGAYDQDEFIVAAYGGAEKLSEGQVISGYGDGLGGFEYDYGEGAKTYPSILIKYLVDRP